MNENLASQEDCMYIGTICVCSPAVYLRMHLDIHVCTTSHPRTNTHTYIHTYTHTHTDIFTNPSARAGYNTRSGFQRSLTDLNSEFFFS